jgi:hypothetical protein
MSALRKSVQRFSVGARDKQKTASAWPFARRLLKTPANLAFSPHIAKRQGIKPALMVRAVGQ